MGLIDKGLADHRTVLQHILQIHEIAVVHVLCKVIRIVEMDQSLLICLNDFFRKKKSSCQVLADLTRHIITLYAVDDRVLVGILLHHFLIITLDKRKNSVIRGIAFSHQRSCITIFNIASGHIKCTLSHDLIFHHVLHFFHGNRTVHLTALKINILRDLFDLFLGQFFPKCSLIGLSDGSYNLLNVKINL